jgi:ABC-2 type transport system permease protein
MTEVTAAHSEERSMRAAVGSRSRPAPANGMSAALTFAWRALLKIKHVPEQLADVIGIPLLFTVLFTYLFGGALTGSTHSYLQFLLPGTLVLAVVFLTVYSGVTLNADLSTGAFDRFRSMPTWRPAPIIGGLIGDAGRYLLASLLVLGLGYAMGFRAGGGAVGLVAATGLVVLFGLALSWVWTAVGAVLRAPSAVLSVGLVVLFPLTFMSNVFVDPKTMPAWLRDVAHANPVTHLVTAERGLLHGTANVGEIGWVLVAAAVLTIVFAPLTMYLYGRER